jgi:hypothetical protein
VPAACCIIEEYAKQYGIENAGPSGKGDGLIGRKKNKFRAAKKKRRAVWKKNDIRGRRFCSKKENEST